VEDTVVHSEGRFEGGAGNARLSSTYSWGSEIVFEQRNKKPVIPSRIDGEDSQLQLRFRETWPRLWTARHSIFAEAIDRV
jgi:hypothetical protein